MIIFKQIKLLQGTYIKVQKILDYQYLSFIVTRGLTRSLETIYYICQIRNLLSIITVIKNRTRKSAILSWNNINLLVNFSFLFQVQNILIHIQIFSLFIFRAVQTKHIPNHLILLIFKYQYMRSEVPTFLSLYKLICTLYEQHLPPYKLAADLCKVLS